MDLDYVRTIELWHTSDHLVWQPNRKDMNKERPSKKALEEIYQGMLLSELREEKLKRILNVQTKLDFFIILS